MTRMTMTSCSIQNSTLISASNAGTIIILLMRQTINTRPLGLRFLERGFVDSNVKLGETSFK